MSRALVFDCDGVIADTERDGHLVAFNATFRAAGLPFQWSEDDYGSMLSIGGGKERLATLFTPALAARANLPTDPDERRTLVTTWHREKTERYTQMIRAGTIPGRPGVARLVAQAIADGWRLAVASTSAEESVRAVLEHAVGIDLARRFSIFAGDVVRHKKPAPDIYLLALREMGLRREEVVVVEDSPVGLQASLGAGLTTIVTTSTYTIGENFPGAALVVTSLGDPPRAPATVLADPYGLGVQDEVELTHLARLLDRHQSGRRIVKEMVHAQ